MNTRAVMPTHVSIPWKTNHRSYYRLLSVFSVQKLLYFSVVKIHLTQRTAGERNTEKYKETYHY